MGMGGLAFGFACVAGGWLGCCEVMLLDECPLLGVESGHWRPVHCLANS